MRKKGSTNCWNRLAAWVGTTRRESTREQNAEFFSRWKLGQVPEPLYDKIIFDLTAGVYFYFYYLPAMIGSG